MGKPPEEVTVNFERGLKTVESPIGARRSMAGLTNVWLSPTDFGALEAMPGYAKKNSSEISNAVFHSMASARKSDGTRLRLVSYQASGAEFIVDVNPTTGAQTTIASNATSPAITVPDFSSAVLNDLVFFCNGTDAGFKYNFSALSAAGVTRPDVSTGTSLALLGSSTNVIGVVAYYVSKMTDTTEGALSLAIDGPTGDPNIDCGTGDEVRVTLDDGTGLADGTYRVYRTLADGPQPFFLSQVVVSGATTAFDDSTSDGDLTNLPYLHGDPPPAALISLVVFAERLWGLTADSIVYWTDVDDPESWWTEANGFKAPVNEDDGDESVCLVRDLTGLYVFKKDHIYRIQGSTPEDLQISEFEPVTQEGRNLGTVSCNSIVSAHSAIAFYWNRGVYLLRGGVVDYISRDIEDDLSTIAASNEADGVYLGFHPKRRHLWVSLPLTNDESGSPTHTYIYDLDARRWIGRRDVGFRGFLSTFDASGDEEFWGCSNNSGFIYELESGQTAAGSAMSTEADLPPFYGNNPASTKNFHSVGVHFAPQASGSFDIELIVDGKSADTDTITVSQVSANTDREIAWVHFGHPGRELKVKIKSSADQPAWKVFALTYRWQEYAGVSRP